MLTSIEIFVPKYETRTREIMNATWVEDGRRYSVELHRMPGGVLDVGLWLNGRQLPEKHRLDIRAAAKARYAEERGLEAVIRIGGGTYYRPRVQRDFQPSAKQAVAAKVELATFRNPEAAAPVKPAPAKAAPVARTYRLASAKLCYTPNIVRMAIEAFRTGNKAWAVRLISDGWKVPEAATRALLSGRALYRVEGETVVFTA